MKRDRTKDLLNIFIENETTGISLSNLSEMTGLSERQCRNYINKINFLTKPFNLITKLKSRKYKISSDYKNFIYLIDRNNQEPKYRLSEIISTLLLAKEDIELQKLEDELYISGPTLEKDLKKIIKILVNFDLKIIRNKNLISLEGNEKNKRKLASYMITNDNINSYVENSQFDYLNSNYNSSLIKKNLIRIFEEEHLIFNDYSLNNIVLHLVIIIDRLKNNYVINETKYNFSVSETEIEATNKIIIFLEKNFNIEINSFERKNLLLFLSCNLTTVDYNLINSKNLDKFIDNYIIRLTKDILGMLTDYYFIENIDDIFITRFSLHINNLIKRTNANFSLRSQLSFDIKSAYPLIYDIAVSVADMVSSHINSTINEDEINFIALHIGGLVENQKKNGEKLEAIYIYSNYHDLYKYNIEKLQNEFYDILNIKYSISWADFNKIKLKNFFIISETDIDYDSYVKISPFIKENELSVIKNKLFLIKKEIDNKNFFNNLISLFKEPYFLNNIISENKYEVISNILNIINKNKIFDNEFVESVITREKISSTYFNNGVAIPHAISPSINKSFISITTYDPPIKWEENKDVQIIIIIGISYIDRKVFRSVFNKFLELLNNTYYINELSKATTYEETLLYINHIINKNNIN